MYVLEIYIYDFQLSEGYITNRFGLIGYSRHGADERINEA
jgi:hypothetical protein